MVISMLLVEGEEFYPHQYATEEELEKLVEQNSKKIFGEDSLYLNLKSKIKSQSGIGSIPDGYVFTISKPYKWYIIEAELANHPIYEHIVSQLNKFIIGIKNLDSRRRLVRIFYEAIKADKAQENWLRGKIGSEEVYKFLTDMIDEAPSILVVIDENTPELEEALSEFTLPTKIIEFETYKNKNDEKPVYRFEPLYNSASQITPFNPIAGELKPQTKKAEFYEEQFFINAQKSLQPEYLEIVKELYSFSKTTSDKINWGYSSQKGITSFSPYYLKEGKIIEPFTLYPDGKMKIYLDYSRRTLSKEKYEKFIFNLIQIEPIFEKSLTIKTPSFNINSFFINKRDKLEKFKEAVKELR